MNSFQPPASTSYHDTALRQVPGLLAVHRMVSMLVAERTPDDGRVLVVGAGGGLETRALAEAHPGWSFDGVDPSEAMLSLARATLTEHADRVQLHQGYIADAPEGPFDAAVSLLTFHFIVQNERLSTLREIHRRLKPGAPFVLAHISFPQTEPERSHWIARHVAYGQPDDVDPDILERGRQAIGTRLTILAPAEEEAMLREAGFDEVSLFYAALSFKGWVAYASRP
ncbi:MAG: methyltransferase [Devosia sp.]|nr:methyltransferase [Devosia sp.]